MNEFINFNKNQFDEMKTNFLSLHKILKKKKLKNDNFNNNLISKLRILNNNINDLNDDLLEILIDLKNDCCEINKNILDKINLQEKVNDDIKNIIPILLLIQMYNINLVDNVIEY